jgi:hypothetical protein
LRMMLMTMTTVMVMMMIAINMIKTMMMPIIAIFSNGNS